nr:MAG: cytochrome c [Hyphomicrobiales bacterium]
MSMYRRRSICALPCAAMALFAFSAKAADAPNLGRVATPQEIARADLIVSPDGDNLPAGSGSVSDGAMVFAQKCVACHGAAGEGGPMDRLTGGVGTIGSDRPVKTVSSYWPYATTLFDYVRRAMPANAPQSLSNDEVFAVTAYLLSIDGIIDDNAVMNADTLPLVEMPNRDGFIPSASN